MSREPDDGIDYGARRPRHQGVFYLPEDPTIPRPDQYGALSLRDLLLLCEFWRFGALHWLRREKPDEFRHVFDSLPARRDVAVESMRTLIIKAETETARSAYYFAEHKFAHLTELIVRACKDFGVDPQPVHEFLDYRDADLEKAIRAVGLLEWRLKGELTREPTAKPEPEDTEPVAPPGGQPERTDADSEWPSSGRVAVSTIMHAAEYKKDGTNPKRTTIQGWEKRESVTKEYHAQSNEVAYPQGWVSKHWNNWSPRPPKRNTPT